MAKSTGKEHTIRVILFSLVCMAIGIEFALMVNTHLSTPLAHVELNNSDTIPHRHVIDIEPYEVQTFKHYKIIHGIAIPTLQEPRNWHGHGFDINCTYPSYRSSKPINFSTWRQDGTGANAVETMKFIAYKLSNPSKYHFYYFPWLFFVHFDTGKVDDLTQMA
eukprot:771727_1